jgi:hypothetical protein
MTNRDDPHSHDRQAQAAATPEEPETTPIIDLLALLFGRKPRPGYRSLEPASTTSADEPYRPPHPGRGLQPVTASEAPHFQYVPRDPHGALRIRSQIGAFELERAITKSGRMQLFSFDEDNNCRHYIARYERAGLPELAEPFRKKLAEFEASLARGEFPHWRRLDAADRDCTSEKLMAEDYGTPEEDRARLLQVHRRSAELAALERRGLPARANAYELT